MRTLSQNIGAERIIDKRPMKAHRLSKTEYVFGLAGKIMDWREELSDLAHRNAMVYIEELLGEFLAHEEDATGDQGVILAMVIDAINFASNVDNEIIREILRGENFRDGEISTVQESRRRQQIRMKQRYNQQKKLREAQG